MALTEQLKPDEYDAFISYSSQDSEFAGLLEKRLEAYNPPRELEVPRRRLNIFRDEGDLTGTEYFRSIDRHLRRSNKLIVICTPATRNSEYVDDEISRFVAARGSENVIPLLLAGIPNNEATPEQAMERAFPDALCEAMQMPLAVNYRGFAKDKDKVHKGDFEGAWFTLLANLYEVSREEIEQRDRKRRQRRRNAVAAVAGAIMLSLATLAVIAWWQKGVADDQRNIALRGLSRYLASEAEESLDRRPQSALLLAIEAVRATRDIDGYITPAAERAIRRALSAAGGRPLGNHRGGVVAATFSPDGRRVGTIGRDGKAKVWDIQALDKTPRSISIAPSSPSHLAFSPDGNWLAIGGQEPPFAGLWRIDESNGEVLPLGKPIDRIRVLGFSLEGSRLVMASEDVEVQVWSLENPGTDPINLVGHHRSWGDRGNIMGITQATFDPTGRWLVTTAWDERALLWDLAAAHKPPQILLAENADWKPVYFSRDGRWLALPIDMEKTAWHGRLAVWRFDGPKPVRMVLADKELAALTDFEDTTILGFHPERALLVAASEHHVVVWNLETDPSKVHQIAAYAAALSLDGKWLATAEKKVIGNRVQHRVLVRSVENLEEGSDRIATFEVPVKRITYSPHGRHLTVVDDTGRIWLVQNNRHARNPQMIELDGHEMRIETVAFSPDGRWLLTAPRWGGHSARLWRVDNPSSDPVRVVGIKRTAELEYKTRSGSGGGQPIGGLPNALAFDSHSRWLAIPGKSGMARVVSLSDPVAASIALTGHTRDVTALAFHPDGAWLATADWNHAVRLWRSPDFDRHALELLPESSRIASNVSALAMDPQGEQIATGGLSGKVALWNTRRPTGFPRMIDAHKVWVTDLAFSPDGTRLLTAAIDGEVKIWPIQSLEPDPIVLSGHRDAVTRAIFSADGRWIVTAGIDSLIHVWSENDPSAPYATLGGHSDGISTMVLASDNRWLVTGSLDGTARLWDLQTLDKPSRLLGRFQAPVNVAAMTADKQWIAAGDLAGEIKLWRRENLDRPPAILKAVDPWNSDDDERRTLWALGFSPDGRWLAALAGGELRLWRMRTEEQLELACTLAGRNLSYDAWETHLTGIPYRLTCSALGLHPDFVTVAERLASRGEVDQAEARMRVAKTLEPTLAVEPHARAVELAVESHLEQGRRLARKGRLEAALAELQNVLHLDPKAALDPQAEIARIVDARKLHDKGKALAKSGKVNEAIDAFQRARELDPSLDLDPRAEAKRLNAPLIRKAADRLAREGRLDEAEAMYIRALEDGLRGYLKPADEARRVRTTAILEKAQKIARDGELEGSIETFNLALEFDPHLTLDPVAEARKLVAQHRADLGENLYRQGKITESVAAYQEAVDLDHKVRISPYTLYGICWTGVRQDLATEVLWICNEAVVRKPNNGNFRDRRGIARALTGNIEGAIKDFEAYIAWGPKNAQSAKDIAARKRWIAGLLAGSQPSSLAEIEALGSQQ